MCGEKPFTLTHLRCEYRENPLGIDELRPRLAWQMRTRRRGARQTAYQITAHDETGEAVWDSGKIESEQSTQVEYGGPALLSRQRVTWRVRVWDERGVNVVSRSAWWEMGLLQPNDWTADWIQGGLVGGPRTMIPTPLLRKSFALDKPVASARLYVSALGLFEARLNGRRVGEDALAPGWTEYAKRVRYHVYDVGDLLIPGENALGALLGDGWYSGHVGFQGRQRYGERPRLIAQLEITHTDGTRTTIGTDSSWAVAYGPLLQADLIMGEHWDARLEMPGWDAPGFAAARWLPAEAWRGAAPGLVACNGPAIRRIQELAPVADPQAIDNFGLSRWLFDFGQNLVGVVRLQATVAQGVTLTLRHAEALDVDGRIYTANLRSAQQTDIYTSRGGAQVFEPRFTFHGFRYVEVHGYPGTPPRDLLTAIVIHSDLPHTGEFSCSDPLINQLQHNILWGQKGNFVDVPTDCPQRDERLGWTGDAQVFAPTAAFNMDVAAFFSKWQQDLADAQHESGRIPPIAPDTRFGLLLAKARPGVIAALARDIEARGNHLSTGFVGTPHLPFALSENGRPDLAYALLNQRSWPSWLYSVTQGATTIWERWDGWTKDKGFQTPGMNSFNHYAYGAIGAWLYAVVAGIDLDETQPGFKRIVFRPQPGGGLTRVAAALDGPYGRIESAWRTRGSAWRWRVVVPPNSSSLAHVPAAEHATISADGGMLVERTATHAVYALDAGTYTFVVG